MREFTKRSLTGVVFVMIMVWMILWGPFSLFILLSMISSLALYEFYSILKVKENKILTGTGIISGLFVMSLVFLIHQEYMDEKYLILVIFPVVGIWISSIFIPGKNTVISSLKAISGLIYIVLPVSLIPFLTQNSLTGNYNPRIFVGTLFIIWIYDSAAYVFGILLGKHKMAPRISPKKSWEGFIFGSASAIILALFIPKYFKILDLTDWLILAVLIVLSSTAGDLFESLIKREADIKDSGKFLPGHGGILDRFDSVFMAVPFVFLYIYIFKI